MRGALSLGSSLQITPSCNLPEKSCKAAAAAGKGKPGPGPGKLAIVNLQKPPKVGWCRLSPPG